MADNYLTEADRTKDGYLGTKSGAWGTFTLVFLLMIMDYLDRQIVVSMFPHLKTEFNLNDKQLGMLVSIVALMTALFTVPIAFIVDRWSRPRSILIMGSMWSLATIACGAATNYVQLMVARAVVGLGEAGYSPAGASLIATKFPQRMRSFVIGAFLSAAGFGSILGVVLGGVITAKWGWQAAFGAVGIPGLILALMFFFVKDYKTIEGTNGVPKKPGFWTTMKLTVKPKTNLWVLVGGSAQVAIITSMIAWLPSYFARFHGMETQKAGITAALVILVMSVGAWFWGYLIDQLGLRAPKRKLHGMAALMVITTLVLGTAFGQVPIGSQQIAMIIFGGFMMSCTLGSAPAIVMDVLAPSMRASATSVTTLGQSLLGSATGPFALGMLSDAYGLDRALAVFPLVAILGAACMLKAARYYEADMAAVKDDMA